MTKIDVPQINISRRKFLYGAGAIAAGAALSSLGCQGASQGAGSASGSAEGSEPVAARGIASDAESAAKLASVDTIETQLGSVAVLSVAQDSVFTTEDCEFIKRSSRAVKRSARAHLPYGTLIWANDNDIAACLLPCDTSKPLTKIGFLSLNSGNLHTVREHAVGEKEGFHIFDVRANSQGAVWVEADILDGKWRVYAAKVTSGGTKLGKAHLFEEGDGAWEMPSIAVCGDYAFWQLTPSPSVTGSGISSMLMRARFGDDKEGAKCVYEAPGRMACAPTPSEEGIAIAPRADLEKGSGVYYQLTHINADSGVVDSALALPASMKPVYVAYGPAGFSFSFESIYNYGDGISNLGTYISTGKGAPVYAITGTSADGSDGSAGESAPDGQSGVTAADGSQVEAAEDEGKSFGEWFRFPRSPFTTPAWLGDWALVKSTGVVAGVDLASRKYFSIEPEHALQGYGEYLASEGPLDKIVTFANIDYTPIGGDHIRECNVRIWEHA